MDSVCELQYVVWCQICDNYFQTLLYKKEHAGYQAGQKVTHDQKFSESTDLLFDYK